MHWQPQPLVAAYEAVKGWSELYLHRKTVVWIEGQDPILPALAQRLAREGFKLKSFRAQERAELTQYVQDQQKSILCVLYSEWHWLFDTRLWSETDILSFQELLEQNKLLSINLLYHLLPEIEPLHPYPHTLQIFDFGSDGALAFGRAKTKYTSWLLELNAVASPLISIKDKIVNALQSTLHQPHKTQRQNWIESIEKLSPIKLPSEVSSPRTERQYAKAFLKTEKQWQKESWPLAQWLDMSLLTDKSLAWLGTPEQWDSVSKIAWISPFFSSGEVSKTTQYQERLQQLQQSVSEAARTISQSEFLIER